LENKIQHCDACIITHEHADHVHGIDDLRPLTFDKEAALPVFTHNTCAEHLSEKFPYIFQANKLFKFKPILGGGIPRLSLHAVQDKAVIEGEEFEFHLLPHGHTKSLSFLHKKLAYAIDCKTLPDAWIERLKAAKLDIFILDCVKREPHQTHLHLEASIEIAKKVGAKRTGLIHMGHELEHAQLERELKSLNLEIFPLFDGQVLPYSN
jgi:phosphoribosyl 1,2-cyclic phosphate phosphodiesterase